jgi:RimJ/RimL family protein N-acetyltransferase
VARLRERTPGYGFWVAIKRPTGDFLGWFHLRSSEGDAPDELGYRMHSHVRGRGLATEGALALINVAFVQQGAARVHATTMAINVGSRRVMEKTGLLFVIGNSDLQISRGVCRDFG